MSTMCSRSVRNSTHSQPTMPPPTTSTRLPVSALPVRTSSAVEQPQLSRPGMGRRSGTLPVAMMMASGFRDATSSGVASVPVRMSTPASRQLTMKLRMAPEISPFPGG